MLPSKIFMKKLSILLILLLLLSSCGVLKSKKRAKKRTAPKTVTASKPNKKVGSKIDAIITEAKTYKGTKYKYGGNTKKGIDCSGLIHNAFKKHNINIARTTRELSKTGRWIDIKKIKKGDLVFFATKKNSRDITHAGIVTTVNGKDISFIHASSSKGVMVSNLTQRYWYLAYVQARRYL